METAWVRRANPQLPTTSKKERRKRVAQLEFANGSSGKLQERLTLLLQLMVEHPGRGSGAPANSCLPKNLPWSFPQIPSR